MSASQEWTDWHLSPAGWAAGDKKRDNGTQPGSIPVDRALTIRYIEDCNGYGPVSGRRQEMWRNPDAELVVQLLEKFGAAPDEL